MKYDIVIPLFQLHWNTRCVIEALVHQYQPQTIYIVAPQAQAEACDQALSQWKIESVQCMAEENFFQHAYDLDKQDLAQIIDVTGSLYPTGWYYQQLLKLGAGCGIADLSEDYLVWDSDLLLVAGWPAVTQGAAEEEFCVALLQHNSCGNIQIIEQWEKWIKQILGIVPARDPEASFIPHHMWFNQTILSEMLSCLNEYYRSDEKWPVLMMRSVAEFRTFSEFWMYSSWLKAKAPETVRFLEYARYGNTTERFFDDGTGKFSVKLRQSLTWDPDVPFYPEYAEVLNFIEQEYGTELPSSLSFEASPRHLKKGEANLHLEETRSRWR
ncbi:MAG: hypothetical protein AAF649_08165 [Verrucomicrobiota bacterium]